jgi:hypothetical protein
MFTEGGQVDHSFACVPRGGGGKGGSAQAAPAQWQPITYTDPVSGATFAADKDTDPTGRNALINYNNEVSDRKAKELADSNAAAQQKATDANTAESTFQTSRGNAYTDAMNSVIRSFQLQGVDPQQYMASDIKPALDRAFNSIKDLDPNPAAAFPTSLGDTIVGNVTSGKRTGAVNTLNQTFTPTYTNNVIPDSLTSQYVDTLLNEQFDPLSQQLTNAQKRNTLTDTGYNAALDALNQKKAAARSTITSLGQGIIDTDRSSLNDYISGARDTANNLTLGASFDPSTYIGGASTKANADVSDFGGALRNAVGSTKFADISDLINAGGAVQGATNPTAANPTGGVVGTSPNFLTDDQIAQQKRGLGNAGAF